MIQIRASAEAKGVLNRAAAPRGQKLSEFMLESARSHAEETILDQRTFFLDDKAQPLLRCSIHLTSRQLRCVPGLAAKHHGRHKRGGAGHPALSRSRLGTTYCGSPMACIPHLTNGCVNGGAQAKACRREHMWCVLQTGQVSCGASFVFTRSG